MRLRWPSQLTMRLMIPGMLPLLVLNCDLPQPDERGSALREGWDAANDPGLMLGSTLNFSEIRRPESLSGSVAQPWSDSYWPLSEGGIARRWISPETVPDFQIAGDPHIESDEAYEAASSRSIEAAISDATDFRNMGTAKTWAVSPAEKYDIAAGNQGFNLTRSELKSYVDNRRTYEKHDIPWGWMGHCHGWAEVSMGLPAPRRAVLARNRQTGEQVLFSPGDIRALLTKIASDNESVGDSRFAGTRCEDKDNDIPRDRSQRIVDAALGIWDSEMESLARDTRVSFRAIFHSRFDQGESFAFPYAILARLPKSQQGVNATPDASELIWVQGSSWLDQQHHAASPQVFSVRRLPDGQLGPDMILWAKNQAWIGRKITTDGNWVTDSNGAIFSDIVGARVKLQSVLGEELAAAADANPQGFAFKSFKECRDVNPATFHTTLVHWLGGGVNSLKHGFVLDKSRTEQVWNQGVWRFRSRIGELTPLDLDSDGRRLSDPFQVWRDPRTVAIADVETTVDYGVENGPMLAYSAEDESSGSMTLRYTLEFDSSQRLVGAEWHAVKSDGPLSGAELLADLQAGINERVQGWQQAPDFVWGNASPTMKFKDSPVLRARVVEAIHACSISTSPATGRYRWFPDTNEEVDIPYVSCDID